MSSPYRDEFRINGYWFGEGEKTVAIVGAMRGDEIQQQYIEQFIERGIRAGLVRANINKEYTSHLFAKVYTDALRDFEKIESKGHNLPQFCRVATDILMRGILSEEGLKLFEN